MTFKRDALERIGATFVQAGLGVVSAEAIVEAMNTDSGTTKAIIMVIATSVFSALKAWAAKHIGDTESASLVK